MKSRLKFLVRPSKFNVNDIISILRKSSNPQLTRGGWYRQASAHEIFDEIDEAQMGPGR
jgi:hypothetical protein